MTGRAVFGTILALVGVGILLERLDILAFGEVVSMWWPLILVAIGALKLLGGALFAGIILVLVGLVLQAGVLGVLPDGFFGYAWPAALIILGVWLVASRGGRRGPRTHAEDEVRQFVAFGGLETRNESQSFQGGSVTAIFGGADLDLRAAKITGDSAVLDATAIFGGVEVRVPHEWKVVTSGTPLLGGWEDKTEYRGEPGKPSPTLEVKGLAMFGGVEVKN